jgi:hypothetical protein
MGSIGLQYIQITAEEKGPKFEMADGVTVTGIFTFRDGVEIMDIQTFNQKGGFGVQTASAGKVEDGVKTTTDVVTNYQKRQAPTFQIEKIPGGSPHLYEAADESWFYGGRTIPVEYQYKYFDASIIIARGGDILRTFDYKKCTVVNYTVETYSDKEEAYMGKGFAVIDRFDVECDGYKPQNAELKMIQYNETMEKKNGSHTVSSLQLKQPFETWSDNFKYTKYKP